MRRCTVSTFECWSIIAWVTTHFPGDHTHVRRGDIFLQTSLSLENPLSTEWKHDSNEKTRLSEERTRSSGEFGSW